ncbi:hypothetical protein TYRP_008790 [Tyrophagus putrescentiae]|nr:hypothetical protein TYRP_008790 [Tyrophagus putrescentiae]
MAHSAFRPMAVSWVIAPVEVSRRKAVFALLKVLCTLTSIEFSESLLNNPLSPSSLDGKHCSRLRSNGPITVDTENASSSSTLLPLSPLSSSLLTWIVAAVNASLLKFGIVAAIVSRLTAAAVAVAGRGNLSHHGGGIVLLLLLSTVSAKTVRNFSRGPRADEALSAAAAAERYGNGATAAAAQVHCVCTD